MTVSILINVTATRLWSKFRMCLRDMVIATAYNRQAAIELEAEDQWMELAFVMANEALQKGEVPVGCIFVFEGQIIAEACNSVNETHNATRHAEMNCLDQAITWCKDNNQNFANIMTNTEVWVTVEPCIMCAAMLHNMHVAKVIYGCNNDRFGGCTSVLDTSKLCSDPCPMLGGVQSERAMNLLKNFYKGTNPNAPKPKVKKKKCDT